MNFGNVSIGGGAVMVGPDAGHAGVGADAGIGSRIDSILSIWRYTPMTTASERVFAHPASRLALEVFRLNGALTAAGDTLVGPLGLTSARWQVMGAVAEARGGLPVAGIARNMGLVRQSVQRIANELEAEGILRFAPNPHHRRAKLVQLTARGDALFESASAVWLALADTLVAGIAPADIEQVADLMRSFRNRLRPPPDQGGTP
ncbi:MarR family winged helix-turn-helix transcriptional regulator [Azospirillum sp. ST 5-10]|uniref:MarR family winged helix-turn-helix transcriptional regulator n=1 Tax=unclassified Azospirillum TaxID=2630922 RepID=UPI003F4A509D